MNDEEYVFIEEDIYKDIQNVIVFKLGVFLKFILVFKWMFICSLMYDFLVVRYLFDYVFEEMISVIKDY